jgi:DNA-directed RNA polymerase subunit RPC12/RpoP
VTKKTGFLQVALAQARMHGSAPFDGFRGRCYMIPMPEAGMPAPDAPQVRWCPECSQPAVLRVPDHLGLDPAIEPATKVYRCQNCGAKYAVAPRLSTAIGLLIGVMAGVTIIGLPVFFSKWRQHKVGARIPVVPMAPVPPVRFATGHDERACHACRASASVVNVKRSVIDGYSHGTEYLYRCGACGSEFAIQSVWGIGFTFLAAGVVGGLAALFFTFATSTGWRWGSGALCSVVALLLVAQGISQWRTRGRHRIVEPPLHATTHPSSRR